MIADKVIINKPLEKVIRNIRMLYPIYKNKRLLLADICAINFSVLAHEILHPIFGILALVIMMFIIINTIFMVATYTNKELNRFWKSKGTLDVFIKVNKNYMGTLVLLLALILFLNILAISCEFNGSICLLAAYIVLTRSWMMTCHYLDTYKNSYSERVINEK